MKHGPRKILIPGLIALALLCIAAVELIVCRFYDPALFRTITAPVTDAVESVSHAVSAAADECVRCVTDAINAAREKWEQRQLEAQLRKAQNVPLKGPPAAIDDMAADNQVSTAPLIESSVLLCDPSVTYLKTDCAMPCLTGGLIDVVYFNQGDEQWGDLYYGSDKISSHGCGPTAMAMVVSSMTDTPTDPAGMCRLAVTGGHWARGSGSYHSIVMGISADFGLECTSFPSRDADALREELLSGKLFVALMGPGHFTRGGHFIVLRGVTLSGDILVADPNSLERSLTAWDAQLLLDELSKSTTSGSPLWLISAPKAPLS